MHSSTRNKRKIVNDPVHGFINIPYDIIFDLIEHPFFQRLRRIKQLGLTSFVYPGATHTRFQHALGAAYLMNTVISVLRHKGQDISDHEAEAASIAILLHDIGHGPFSHALENTIIKYIDHEELSILFMNELNRLFNQRLDLAIQIFTGQYHKKFLHQLVASQLDMDRLDYLKRDSFFTGVTEGVIGSDRIVRMMNVANDQLVVDIKGIYSIEKFLIARRLMYWQVYFHKAVLSAELLLVNILKRAKELAGNKVNLFSTPALEYFLYHDITRHDFLSEMNDAAKENQVLSPEKSLLYRFASLDDNDIISSAKTWAVHQDPVLSRLCRNLINRNLYRIELQKEEFEKQRINRVRETVMQSYGIDEKESDYFVFTNTISNYAYSADDERIQILLQNGDLKDVTEASDMLDMSILSKTVTKHYLCYPKDIEIIK
ncbi:MAG: phosphohydrolase [Bacteroides sp. SM23_62_1]|nr:MAG: phosphohydrolase [Bacteroides sp. SM23_62_1]